ncbi:MAG: phospholipase D-like domain-containing protein [Candidatus Micrarchaeota archaeon]
MRPSLAMNFLLILLGIAIGLIASEYFEGPIPQKLIANAKTVDFCLASAIISPGAGDEMVAIMDNAKSSIHIILFEFSYPDLKEALVHAAQRGVDVKLILDPKVSQNLDTAKFLKAKGIDVKWSSSKFNYNHAKTAILDGRKVLTGSINWSRNAMTRNREIGVLVEDLAVASELEGVFWQDWNDASEVK